jgi:hypothetical protein
LSSPTTARPTTPRRSWKSSGKPVRLLRLPHRGAGAARNAGLEAARGPLVAFLDSDDEWFPDKLDLQRTFMERRPDVLYACSDFGVRMRDGSERRRFLANWMIPSRPLRDVFDGGVPYSSIAPLPAGREDFPVYIGSHYLEEMHNNIVAAFTFIARKAEAEEALWFADDLPICEDWHAFGRVARAGPGAVFDTETAWQNGHSGPRVTDNPLHVLAAGWLTALDRVWGQDSEFRAEHEDEFRHDRRRPDDEGSLAGALRQAARGPHRIRPRRWRSGRPACAEPQPQGQASDEGRRLRSRGPASSDPARLDLPRFITGPAPRPIRDAPRRR